MPPAQVAPGLYLGDRKDAKDRAALRRLNIQSIVNCTPPKSEDPAAGCPSFFERELRYLRVPIYDSPAEDAAEHFASVLDFIASRLHHGGVLVHCNRGVSRSATFVVAHLMKARALDPASALELVRAARPQAEPNAAFLKQLDGVLHAELEASRKRDAARMGAGRPARRLAPARARRRRPSARPSRARRGPERRRSGAAAPHGAGAGATATAGPAHAIGCHGTGPRAGSERRPTGAPAPRGATPAAPARRAGADDDDRARALAAALERVAAAAAVGPKAPRARCAPASRRSQSRCDTIMLRLPVGDGQRPYPFTRGTSRAPTRSRRGARPGLSPRRRPTRRRCRSGGSAPRRPATRGARRPRTAASQALNQK